MSAEFPIYRVTTTGTVERLGIWRHDACELVLEREGYPLLAPGTHKIDGDLPWLFWDMTPSGFMGALFAAQNPSLFLNLKSANWNRDEVLRALTLRGGELPGNLLIGDQAIKEFRSWTWSIERSWMHLHVTLESLEKSTFPSTLGGEQPKFIADLPEGQESLIKFVSDPTSLRGGRWQDLLRCEAHCSSTFLNFKIRAVQTLFTVPPSGRPSLMIVRYDRLPQRGRVPTGRLCWLAMERWGDDRIPAPEVTRMLVESGELPEQDAETCATVHAFSAAIGNNDAHLGNYGLVFDEHGKARLAPIYDVLPMVFAPRHDELPDQYVKPRSEKPAPKIQAMVEDLAKRIEGDQDISKPFKELWLRYVGL